MSGNTLLELTEERIVWAGDFGAGACSSGAVGEAAPQRKSRQDSFDLEPDSPSRLFDF